MPAFQALELDLFGEGADSVRVERRPWGFFDVVVLTASKAHLRDTAVALLGSGFSAANQGALYLTDESLPLAVNEDAQIRGGAWLPRRGDVRPGNLPLTGPARTGAAVTGTVRPSTAALPLNADSASTLARLREYAGLRLSTLLPAGTSPRKEQSAGIVSFLGRPGLLYQSEAMTLTGRVSGQVVIASGQRLVVEANCQLDDVLLLAPTIIVKPGFWGRVQLIARDTVLVGDNCQLNYPSAVGVYGPGKVALLSLGAGCRVRGVVAAASAEPGLGSVVQLTPTTLVEGQVFSAGVIVNCGVVRGPVMCRRLLYHGVGSFFENYLVNSTLDRAALPATFLSSRLLNPAAPSGVVAWLH